MLGGNDLDYNNDRILVRHIDSYNMDLDQWTRCSFSLLTGGQTEGATHIIMQNTFKFTPTMIDTDILCFFAEI